ncbi:unnamed protein product [Linum tenue]|uniref:Small ribosomal subunit protein uS5c n=1 Tax=Linum tenue TaxID=586396 RepID=A0AAV0PC08_9ROSI|nr:unnamed protein product [Linum tenue]
MAATTLTLSSSSSSISLHNPTPRFFLLNKPASSKLFLSSLSRLSLSSTATATITVPRSNPGEIDTSFFDDEFESEEEIVFDPPTPPEGFIAPPYFDEGPPETEDEIAAAYEELYGPAYSGESYLGKDIYVMDSKAKKMTAFGKVKKDKIRDGFEERVIQVRRVTKVVKGGKQLHFRAIVVVGDKQGQVGVGVGKAKEVIGAVQKSAINARRNIITVPLTKYSTFPHSYAADLRAFDRSTVSVISANIMANADGGNANVDKSDGKYGAANVMLRPASPGTGVIAGGAVRIVLEMAGVENALGKQLGSNNALNNARATVVAVQKMRQFRDVARERGIPMEELWK